MPTCQPQPASLASLPPPSPVLLPFPSPPPSSASSRPREPPQPPMADRMPQYSMLPNFNNGSLLQQQQAHQQQQQQQQQLQHQSQSLQDAHPNMSQSSVDQIRAWQMQQYRASGAADMNAANPAQFTEMMKRTHSLHQAHPVRQQPLNQQQPQQFGIGSGLSQMNSGPPVMGGPSQQQQFHDTSSPHSQPSHIPSGFPNISGMSSGNPNQPQVRNPQSILQSFPPSGVSRQLELMNMAQNQQPQNGPVNINKFNPQQLTQHQLNQLREREQQQQQQFSSAGMNPATELFSSPAISNETLRRPSPHPANAQQPLQPQQELRPGGLNLAELMTRVNMVRPQVAQQEATLHALKQQHDTIRGSPQEAQLIARINEVQADLNRKKEQLSKMAMAASLLQKQKAAANGNAGPSGAGQQAWMSHPQPFDGTSNARNPGVQLPPSQFQQNSIQSSPSLAPSQSQANHLVNQGFVPQRSGPTPQHSGQAVQQHNASPFNSLQPPTASQFPFSSQQATAGPSQSSQLAVASSQGGNVMNNFSNGPNLGMIPPLDKARFDVFFKNYSIKSNLKLDTRLLNIDNRQVELHRLHVEVLKEGGFQKVDQKDMWNIIGGRLGFVQFPGTDTEPAKSGPGVAQQMAHIYKEYLALFEQWYIADSSKRLMAAGNMQQAHFNSAAGGRWNAQPLQMQKVVQMSHLSVAELQARGIDEKTIAFVETNRASLQRTYQEQKTFQNKIWTANLTQPAPLPAQVADQNGLQIPRAPVMTASDSFSAGSPAQHHAAALVRQQFVQQQQQLLQAQQGQQQSQQSSMQGNQALLQATRMPSQHQPPNMPPRLMSDEAIMKIKHEYNTNSIPAMRPVDVPVEHRLEFNQLLEQLYRQCNDADTKLKMIAMVIKQEDFIRKLIAIICTIQSQRNMLSTVSNPRYIVSFETLKNMTGEMQRILEAFTSMFNAFRQQRQQMAMNQLHNQGSQLSVASQQQRAGTNPIVPPMPMMSMHDMMFQTRPPVSHQLPITAGPSTQQPQIASSLRPPPVLQPPPVKRAKGQPPSSNVNAASTPSPAPVQSASTPSANAATPTATASSPSAVPTKSPKTRAPAKPKAPPASRRRPSKAAPAPAASSETVQPVASSSTPNAKRPREEDSPLTTVDSSSGSSKSAPVANEPSPPKRAKTEWESPPTEEMKKKDEAVENIKTEDDAAAFFVEQMTDLFKMAGGDGQSSLPPGISETLEMILKGYGSVPDHVDGASNMGGESSALPIKEVTPPPAAMTDAFDEFFDFSFGMTEDDDNNSKAPTPDLVSSSSTNPSPESNHESDVSHHTFLSNSLSSTTDVKTEEAMDPLRLGPWKSIDGGEGAYYQANDWKWDSPMPSQDQPWAIFNS